MGFASGGNIGAEHAMFEPVHGSAPKYRGKNQVNPFATFFASSRCSAGSATGTRDSRLAAGGPARTRRSPRVLSDGPGPDLRPGRDRDDERRRRPARRGDPVGGAMSGRSVALVGGATTPFGVRPTTWAEMAQEVGVAPVPGDPRASRRGRRLALRGRRRARAVRLPVARRARSPPSRWGSSRTGSSSGRSSRARRASPRSGRPTRRSPPASPTSPSRSVWRR